MVLPASTWEEWKLIFRFLWASCIGRCGLPPAPLYAEQSLLILDFLRKRDAMYGYQIVTALCAQYPDKRDRLMYGHLYPVFQKLVTNGLLRAEKRPAPPNKGPYRVYYRLTTLGHSIFPDQCR